MNPTFSGQYFSLNKHTILHYDCRGIYREFYAVKITNEKSNN